METTIPTDPVLERDDKSTKKNYEQSDHGNAKRLLDKYGDIIRYHSSDMGEGWFIWDSKRWCKDKRQDIFQKAKDTIDHMYDELRALPENEQRNRLKFILQSKNQRGLNSMIASAQNEPGVFLEMDQFDSHKDNLNVLNGMVDLTKGKLDQYDLEILATPEDLFFFSKGDNSILNMMMKKNRFGYRKLRYSKGSNGKRNIGKLLKLSKIIVLD